jgi:hypothetical protein
MNLDELVGKEFIVKSFPVLYLIVYADPTQIKVQAKTAKGMIESVQDIGTSELLSAYSMGHITFIGEPVLGIKKPNQEETSKEDDEPSNYFSFDDI